jgi:hypothetical protein
MTTVAPTGHALGMAVDAANRVRNAHTGRPFDEAVKHFRHVLSAMPDDTFGPLSRTDAHTLEQLSEDVIARIEGYLTSVTDRHEAATLASDIYRIRALVEETNRSHYYAFGRPS